MRLKIKHSEVVAVRAEQIKAYLLSKALRNEDCTDAEIKKVYKISDADFDAAADILIKGGVAEKT